MVLDDEVEDLEKDCWFHAKLKQRSDAVSVLRLRTFMRVDAPVQAKLSLLPPEVLLGPWVQGSVLVVCSANARSVWKPLKQLCKGIWTMKMLKRLNMAQGGMCGLCIQ